MHFVLTINGGSSSIKFALFQTGEPLKRGLHGKVDRIGLSGTTLTFNEPTKKKTGNRKLAAADHKSAANSLIDWLEKQIDFKSVKAVGHRVVHGMKHTEPEIVTPELLDELHHGHPPYWKRAHHDWRIWFCVIVMLAAMERASA
jgi:acetate kinase